MSIGLQGAAPDPEVWIAVNGGSRTWDYPGNYDPDISRQMNSAWQLRSGATVEPVGEVGR